jgi:hypothetical protein
MRARAHTRVFGLSIVNTKAFFSDCAQGPRTYKTGPRYSLITEN